MRCALLLVVFFCALMSGTSGQSDAVDPIQPPPGPEPVSAQTYRLAFAAFMGKYHKSYPNDELHIRFGKFKANYNFVREHNKKKDAGLETFDMEVNQFADMNWSEFSSKMLGLHKGLSAVKKPPPPPPPPPTPAVPVVDWVAQGKVHPVKDQGSCGSCYAFSAVGAVESAVSIKYGTAPVSLSEQQVVDCDKGNYGCQGGWMDAVFSWIMNNEGITTTEQYPYVSGGDGKTRTCPVGMTPAAQVSGWYTLPAGTASQRENAMGEFVKQQPLSVAVAANNGFQFYKGGVLTSGCGRSINHAVLLTGYFTQSDSAYWRIKNSWGPLWGDQGFMNIKKGLNLCLITHTVNWPVVV
jgi:KDEL-tailed cysteine endopeptidase